jgi:hypothetical protein
MKTRSAFKAAWLTVAFLSSANCGGSGTEPVNPGVAASAADYPGKDLGLPPVADGFVRYETQPVMVAPEQDVMWEEWVAPPLASDMDAVDVTGAQSKGGHHANLYATTDVKPVGTNHAFQQADQLTQRTLGGVGGEGNSAIELPPGVVFRVSKGSALLIQSHFINASPQTIAGRSVLDVKLTTVDPSAQVASIMTNVTVNISIPPGGQAMADFKCLVKTDFRSLMWANHMHSYGVSATTELINADGTTTPLQVDPHWESSWAFHPNYTTFPVQTPRTIPAGSTLHTTCTWANSTSQTVKFPDEMCIFAAFFLGEKDATCLDGTWQ